MPRRLIASAFLASLLTGCAGMLTNRQSPRVLEKGERIYGGSLTGVSGLRGPSHDSKLGPVDLYWRRPVGTGLDMGLSLNSFFVGLSADLKARLTQSPLLTCLIVTGSFQIPEDGSAFISVLSGNDSIYVGVREGYFKNLRRVPDDAGPSFVAKPPTAFYYYEHGLISQFLVGYGYGETWRIAPELSCTYLHPGKVVLLLTAALEYHLH